MRTEAQRMANRQALMDGIHNATKPQKTGRFHFDGMKFYEDNRLELQGDHGTPDYMVTFFPKCQVEIFRMDRPQNVVRFHVPYSDFNTLAQRIVDKAIAMLF